jgi:hypothetical protein
MSPPEVWGPPVWTLFHTLCEKINPYAYKNVIGSMFLIITRICKFLPCPDCSRDATNFLAKLKLSDYKTKDEFKNMFYLFHNWVNAKKRKPLFNYSYMSKYSSLNLGNVLSNFISKYNTKGNMKLLSDSFQREIVIRDLLTWFRRHIFAFVQPTISNPPPVANEKSSEELKDNDDLKEHSNEIEPTKETIHDDLCEKTTITENVIQDNDSSYELISEEQIKPNEVIIEECVNNKEGNRSDEILNEEDIISNEVITEDVSEVINEHVNEHVNEDVNEHVNEECVNNNQVDVMDEVIVKEETINENNVTNEEDSNDNLLIEEISTDEPKKNEDITKSIPTKSKKKKGKSRK